MPKEISIKSLNRDIAQLSKVDRRELVRMIVNRVATQSAIIDKSAGVYINSKKISPADIEAIEIFVNNKLIK